MFNLPSPITPIDFFEEQNITLLMKRDDLIHPEISGNKYRKLKYNLLETNNLHIKHFVTKGGAFSNHIHAAAAAGNFFEKNIIGIIRGEKIDNETLDFAQKNKMQLVFVNRSDYRTVNAQNFQDFLPQKFENAAFIPEGGTNTLAIRGVAEMIGELKEQLPKMPDYICSACGTGGTLTGIIEGLAGEKKAIGFSVLKGDFMTEEIKQNQVKFELEAHHNWEVMENYHFGGYAKTNEELFDFIHFFYQKHQILLDPIYTSKMMFGIFDLIKKGFFPKSSSIMAVHTGGLQGWNGFPKEWDKIKRSQNEN